jgi:hypothetical protein
MKLDASEVFDFGVLDELREEIEAANLKFKGVPYYYQPGFLTYSDYNVRQGRHGPRILSTLEFMLSQTDGFGSYLDIGCMDSPALAFLSRSFETVTLVEPRPLYREILELVVDRRRLPNITIVPSIRDATGAFDLISAWETLEHVTSISDIVDRVSVADYWSAKQEFLVAIRGLLKSDRGRFCWSIPVMTGRVFAAKYVACLLIERRLYSKIGPADALRHLVGKTDSIPGPLESESHRGFDERRMTQLMSTIFEKVVSQPARGRGGLLEFVLGCCERGDTSHSGR